MTHKFTHKGLYAIVDSSVHEDYGIERLILDIVEFSQIPVIQFRFKKMNSHKKNEIISMALELKSKRDFTLIMNDDIEFMANEKMDGLHLGQSDIAFGMAKKTYPQKKSANKLPDDLS
jgi:thiamine monophosphate synthase